MTKIFVSASTSELGSFRKAARQGFESIGVTAVVQENFPTDYREIEQLLRETISVCDAVICLVGNGYGFEPANRPPDKSRRSYTQMEYDIALAQQKPIYLLLSTENLIPDNPILDDDEKRRLQSQYRISFPENQIRYSFSSYTDIYKLIAKLPFRAQEPLRTYSRRLPSGTDELFGRHMELELLQAMWYDPQINVASITAWGGAGKTSLIAGWLEKIKANDYCGAERIFVWPFLGEGRSENVDLFFAKAFEFFEDRSLISSTTTPFEKGERLAELIISHRTLLVLDGMESLLESSGPASGRLKDPALRTLLESIASSTNSLCRLCILTTRAFPRDLDRWTKSSVREISLERLDEHAGAELLRKMGVDHSDSELQKASTEFQGHPLTLELLGRYLAAAHDGDIRKRDRVQLQKADAESQGGHAFEVIRTYTEWFQNGGEAGLRQLALLHLIGFFDRPADAGCLDALQKPPIINGLTESLPDLSSDDWNLAISNLQKLGLVRKIPWEPMPIKGYNKQHAIEAINSPDRNLGDPQLFPQPYRGEYYAIEAHPLVREYFAKWMKEHRPDSWRAGNERLYRYLASNVPYWPDGLEGLQPLYQAVVHGCAAERHVEACQEIYMERIHRAKTGEGYSTSIVGSVSSDLAIDTCFFEKPWSKVHKSFPEPGAYWVLRDAAFNLEMLGRLEEAVEPMHKAAEWTASVAMRKRLEFLWLQASLRYDDLSRMELQLGRIAEAKQSAERSCALAESTGTSSLESVNAYATLGDALTQADESIEALRIFQKAELLQHEGLPDPVLFSLRGYQYCEFLLVEPERAAWRVHTVDSSEQTNPAEFSSLLECLNDVAQRAEVIMATAKRDNFPLDDSLGHLLLAKVTLYRAILEGHQSDQLKPEAEKAVKLAKDAHEMARHIGHINTIIRILIFRAWARLAVGDVAEADKDLRNAKETADQCSMRLLAADVDLFRARLFRDKNALVEAKKRIEQLGYFRRKQELDDAEVELLGT